MATITRLLAGKKNPARINLYLDGVFAFALSIDEVVKQGLKKGQEITETEIERLKELDSQEWIYAKVVNFLSYRPRSLKEVRDRLYKYEVKDIATQNNLIDRLAAKGYVNDLNFARWFIASRNTHRPRSLRMLLQELKAKGVSHEVLNEVKGEIKHESETILQLIEKRLGSSRQLSLAERQKISSYLVRQGFAWDHVKQVVSAWEKGETPLEKR